MYFKVMRVGSDTFIDAFIQKMLSKLAILFNYKRPRMLCLVLQPRQTFFLLNELVAEGVVSNPHDFNVCRIICIYLESLTACAAN